jgi:hypothetical protein
MSSNLMLRKTSGHGFSQKILRILIMKDTACPSKTIRKYFPAVQRLFYLPKNPKDRLGLPDRLPFLSKNATFIHVM